MTTSASPGSGSPGSPALPDRLLAAVSALDPLRLLPTRREQLPPPDSLAFYAVLAAIGIAEIVEWPAVLVAAAAQALVDRRMEAVEARLRESGPPPPGAPTR